MSGGFLLIDKPAGPTSHDVVAAVRRAIGERRVGHTGTLDPFATGLLAVLVGRATRLAPYLVGLTKRYTGVIRLGEETDTLDSTGEVVATSGGWADLGDDAIRDALASFLGPSVQTPPRYSAKKIGGQPAHRRVRRGETVALAARPVEVFAVALLERDGPDVAFDVRVSSGTYIRSLAADLGARLGCGGHLAVLRRTEIGPFTVEDACELDGLTREALRPAGDAIPHIPRVMVAGADRAAVCHGRPIKDDENAEGPVALVSDDELLAMADPGDGLLRPRVVLAT